MWVELYEHTAAYVADSLEEGPVIVSGVPGSARAPLVRELLGDHAIIEVRPRQAATFAGLKIDLLGALVATFADAAPPGRQAFNRFVAAAFGERAQDAVRALETGDASGLSLSEVLAALARRSALIVHDAHLLPVLSDRALWALRARAQEPDPPRIALLTREWHRGDLVGPDAAFFGFGQGFDLPIPGEFQWMDVVPGQSEQLSWLLEKTRGLPRVTYAVLDRAHDGVDIPSAWRAHVHASGRVAEEVRRLVHGLHPYAPRLLGAIAAGDRVYASVPEARTDAIAAALRAMRDHDVIYQPRPRKWLVADPALEPHLSAARVP